MSVSSLPRRAHRLFHWLLHLRHRAPKRRKYVLTFGIVLVMIYVKSLREPFEYGGEEIRWILLFLLGAVVTSDYDVLTVFGLDGVVGWIQNPDDIVSVIERSYHAKQYVEFGDERIQLTYWKRGRFRALVDDATHLRTGMRFWVKVDVSSGDARDDIEVPLHLCSVSLERLTETNRQDAMEASFDVIRWRTKRSAIDHHERRQYDETLPKIWTGSDDIDPYLTIQETGELNELSLREWRCLYEGLETVGDSVVRT